MAPKPNNRVAEIRARVARRTNDTPPSDDARDRTPDAALAAASAHFLGAAEHLVQNRSVEALPIGHIAPDLRPAMQQPRLLPPPEDLIAQGEPVPVYRDLVAELMELGHSLQEQQIHPIMVYPGTSDRYPAARYIILVGHRRWTAAMLLGLTTLDAVVVDPPSDIERVRVQYAENEAREEFSDMERAWALTHMKRVLSDAPWDAVELQLNISRSRRHELTRLLSFTQEQQRQIALLRLQETQIRTLHTAVRAEELSPAQVDAILFRLSQIAAERAAAYAASEEAQGRAPRRVRIDGPTVAPLVARTQRTSSPIHVVGAAPTPRWLPPLRDQLLRTNQGVQRAIKRVDALGTDDLAHLLADVQQLTESLVDLIGRTQQTDDVSHPQSDEAHGT